MAPPPLPAASSRPLLDRLGKITTRTALIGSPALLGYLAQRDPFLKELWELAKSASVFGNVMLITFLVAERSERQYAQQELYSRTLDFTQSNYVASSALTRVGTALEHLIDASSKTRLSVERLLGQLSSKSRKGRRR